MTEKKEKRTWGYVKGKFVFLLAAIWWMKA
jgi:hypothetical protein